MNQDLTDITMLIDRSGSMETGREDTIGGVNAFIESQQKGPGEARITLIQFDHQNPQEVLYVALPAADAPPLTNNTFIPRGRTPLYDALGRSIVDTGERLKAIPEAMRPGKVIFVTVTDGLENASREWRHDTLKAKVQHQQEVYNWHFIFIGADIDAMAQGAVMGIASANTVSTDSKHLGRTYAITSQNVNSFRQSGKVEDLGYTDKQRDELKSGAKK